MVLLEELEGCGCLRHFAPEHWPQVASMAQLQEHAAGACVFSEGHSPGHVYLVLEGEVALEVRVPDGVAVRAHRLGPGDLLGWSPVLGLGPMTATARALTRCRLAALDVAQVQALSEQDARFASEVLRATAKALAERLRALRQCLPDARRHEPHAVKEGAD
jgi:CRP-like cAMP-binding protein